LSAQKVVETKNKPDSEDDDEELRRRSNVKRRKFSDESSGID